MQDKRRLPSIIFGLDSEMDFLLVINYSLSEVKM